MAAIAFTDRTQPRHNNMRNTLFASVFVTDRPFSSPLSLPSAHELVNYLCTAVGRAFSMLNMRQKENPPFERDS